MLLIVRKRKKIYKIIIRLLQVSVSAAVPFAAKTFRSTRGASFWNADTRFTPGAFSRNFSTETAVQCAEQKSRNRWPINTHT